jgi:uncharacterized protein YlxW (UPF0749 family)
MNTAVKKTPSERSVRLRQQVMLFLLMLIFGFVVMNHIQSIRASDVYKNRLALYRERQEQLKKVEEQYQSLLKDNETLNNRKAAAIDALLASRGQEQLQAELQQIRLLAGFTEVRGAGIVITLNDKPDFNLLTDSDASLVHDGDIRHVLDLLRSTGVAALAVNNLRVTNASFIQCIGSTIRCNDQRLLPPFVITAIGNPAALAAVITSDVAFILRQEPEIGLIVNVQQMNELVIPAFAEADDFGRYISLLEG